VGCESGRYSFFFFPSPPSFSLTPLSAFLEQFQQVPLFYFHTWIQNTPTVVTLLHPLCLPLPSHRYPLPDRTRFSFLSFIFYKGILIVRGHFTLVFHTCIYCVLIGSTPSVTFSLSPCPRYSSAYSALH
jgi:hypothetical protein